MGGTFQEQLLKLGLVDKSKVDKSKKERHQQRRKKSGKRQPQPVDENKLLAEKALAKKKERAQQLNREREEKLRKREDAARIRQLIETGRYPRDERGVAYRFVDQGKIYRLFVSQEVVDLLVAGAAGIVRYGDGHEVCPTEVVKKVHEIDATVVVLMSDGTKRESGADEDDGYAGYEVPDDLVW